MKEIECKRIPFRDLSNSHFPPAVSSLNCFQDTLVYVGLTGACLEWDSDTVTQIENKIRAVGVESDQKN